MGEEIISGLDLIELEAVCDERPEVHAARSDDFHQTAHPLLPAGAKRGYNLVVSETRSKGAERDAKIGRVDAKDWKVSRQAVARAWRTRRFIASLTLR
jgi:hypothetical protein